MGIHRQIKEFEVQQEPESQKKFNHHLVKRKDGKFPALTTFCLTLC